MGPEDGENARKFLFIRIYTQKMQRILFFAANFFEIFFVFQGQKIFFLHYILRFSFFYGIIKEYDRRNAGVWLHKTREE
jgi:hypothetical protein